jgi:hypothetical protein
MEREGGGSRLGNGEARRGKKRGVRCGQRHTGAGGERGPTLSATDMGVQPMGTGGGRPARARQGTKGGSGQGGSWLGCCHGSAQAHSADFDLRRFSKLNTI